MIKLIKNTIGKEKKKVKTQNKKVAEKEPQAKTVSTKEKAIDETSPTEELECSTDIEHHNMKQQKTTSSISRKRKHEAKTDKRSIKKRKL